MIEAIKEIGEHALKKENKSVEEPLDILIEDPNKEGNIEDVLIIIFKDNGREYEKIEWEKYQEDKLKKYLYKGKKGHSPNFSPTTKITKLETTFGLKILKWFNGVLNRKELYGLNEDDVLILTNLQRTLKENKEEILNDLKEKFEGTDTRKCLITIGLSTTDGIKYPGDLPVFKKLLEKQRVTDYYYSKTYNTKSISKEKACSVCYKKKDEVYGLFTLTNFNIHTVDKPGFITGGFDRALEWKNFPVCQRCALSIEEGFNYLDKHLKFNFYGFRYYLMPKLILEHKGQEEIFDILEDYEKNPAKMQNIVRITDDEGEILEILGEQENYLTNYLLFFRPSGKSDFDILLYIEEVLPSYLGKLFDTKKDVDKIDIFKEIPISKDRIENIEFNFGVLKTFFPFEFKNNKPVGHYKYYLDIVNKIFTNKKIDYPFIIQFVMQKIRSEFTNDNPIKKLTLRGFLLLFYLNELDLLKNFDGGGAMAQNEIFLNEEIEDLNKRVEEFFGKFAEFFNSDSKKAVFLEGVLTQFLLNIQFNERNSTPFRTKLRGLKLDEKWVKKLLPEVQNKLEEYGKNYYRNLESIISKHFVLAGDGWKLSNDEISFYFVLGMNLSHLFKTKTDGGDDNE
jgi:CRISPR-associated protein Csh1